MPYHICKGEGWSVSTERNNTEGESGPYKVGLSVVPAVGSDSSEKLIVVIFTGRKRRTERLVGLARIFGMRSPKTVTRDDG